MSLDPSRLENRQEREGKVTARCPACGEEDQDRKGEHLVLYPDGRFACVVYPGEGGASHRQRIWVLAGDRNSTRQNGLKLRVRRPAHVTKPKTEGTPLDLSALGTLGTLGTPFPDSRATGESASSSEPVN